MNTAQWIKRVQGLPQILEGFDSDTRLGNKEAILSLWSLLHTAPTSVKSFYERISEADILARAETVDSKLAGRGFGFDSSGISSVPEAVLAIGGHLRAMELLLSDTELGSIPFDPTKEWKVQIDQIFIYLIPVSRSLWRRVINPIADHQPFEQRGLIKYRAIPAEIDGAEVILVNPHWPATAGVQTSFGAALFPNLRFRVDEDSESFLVTEVICPTLPEVISRAVEASHEEQCLATVFPELTVDDAALKLIIDELQQKAWLDEKDTQATSYRTPAFVVAGSWHRPSEGGYVNVSPILTGDGQLLTEYHKRKAYVDEEKRVERIQAGKKLCVLVYDNCLVAFGICLDFCDIRYEMTYDDLDVDIVMVPSCGHDGTMKSHIANAERLIIRRNSRTMVVQQAYPRKRGSLGYILPPQAKVTGTPRKFIEKKAWSVVST